MKRHHPATSPAPDGEAELIRRFKAGDAAAGGALLEMHAGVIYTAVAPYLRLGTDPEDVLQVARIAFLEDGVKRFNPKRGAKLTSYACYWARARARAHAVEERSAVRVPAATQQKAGNGTAAARTRVQVANALQVGRLDAEVHTEDGAPLRRGDLLVAPSPGADDALQEAREGRGAANLARLVLGRLRPRERRILERRAMADPEDVETFQALGTRCGVTRERIRQIEHRLLRQARTFLGEMGVTGWNDVAGAGGER